MYKIIPVLEIADMSDVLLSSYVSVTIETLRKTLCHYNRSTPTPDLVL